MCVSPVEHPLYPPQAFLLRAGGGGGMSCRVPGDVLSPCGAGMCILHGQAGRWGSCPRRAAPEEAGELGIPGQAVLAVTQGCLLAPVPHRGFLVRCTGFSFCLLIILQHFLEAFLAVLSLVTHMVTRGEGVLNLYSTSPPIAWPKPHL